VVQDVIVTVREADRVELAAEPASVGQSRRFVRHVLTGWGLDELVDTVCLLTSELATNAVLHARTPFAVVVSRDQDEVRVDVLDGSAAVPRARQHALTAATGRGVAIVARVASRWGATLPAELGGFAKGIWFTVPLAGLDEAAWTQAWADEA
jgi:anti-sigma regulatory factor (Ser/Thr protein kinase)